MQAIRVHEFGEPEVMHLENVTLPATDSDEILIEVKAVGVNPVDTYIRAGWYGDREFPFTPGIDAAGIVAQVGDKVQTITPRQRVFLCGSISGVYAEQVLCQQSQVYPLPDSITFEQGAALGIPYGTAYRGLFRRAWAKKGETVLIHGASGGVGIAAVQLAKTAGLKVIATAGSDKGKQLVAAQGADLVLDHHDSKHLDKAMEYTNGRGVDILLEMLANVNLGNDLPIIAKHGRVVIIGSRGTVEINPRDAMAKEVAILGTMFGLATPEEKEAAYEVIERGLKHGSFTPIIADNMPLADAPKAHHTIMESDHHGKIVLIP